MGNQARGFMAFARLTYHEQWANYQSLECTDKRRYPTSVWFFVLSGNCSLIRRLNEKDSKNRPSNVSRSIELAYRGFWTSNGYCWNPACWIFMNFSLIILKITQPAWNSECLESLGRTSTVRNWACAKLGLLLRFWFQYCGFLLHSATFEPNKVQKHLNHR